VVSAPPLGVVVFPVPALLGPAPEPLLAPAVPDLAPASAAPPGLALSSPLLELPPHAVTVAIPIKNRKRLSWLSFMLVLRVGDNRDRTGECT
jgi:hypothetical protein